MVRGTATALLILLVCSLQAQARPRRRGGTLELNSMTEGASVAIDGEDVGVIPLAARELPPGRHTIKIVKPGYTEYLDVFTIKPGQVTKLDIDLLPFASVVAITANVEGARVFIDGKFEGLAPLEKEALIGHRTIRVSKAGYYDFITTLSSVAGKRFKVAATLKPLPVGSTPYRPRPPAPARWYERWYVWVGAAGGLVAVTLAVVLPVTQRNSDPVAAWGAEMRDRVTRVK
jgi:hypothetical protein